VWGGHEVAELTLHTRRPIALDVHADIAATAGLSLWTASMSPAAESFFPDNYPQRTHDSCTKSNNIYWSRGKVTRQQRAAAQRPSRCVFFGCTGLSGSRQVSIGPNSSANLFQTSPAGLCFWMGITSGMGFAPILGFSPRTGRKHTGAIGEVAQAASRRRLYRITAFISPYREDSAGRRSMRAAASLRLFVNAPLRCARQRDPKGLTHKRALREIKEFTGVLGSLRTAVKPDLEVRTYQLTGWRNRSPMSGILGSATPRPPPQA